MAFPLFLNPAGIHAALKTDVGDVTKVCWLTRRGKGSLPSVSRLKASLRATVLAYVPSQRKLTDSIKFVKHTVKTSGVASVEANYIYTHTHTRVVCFQPAHTQTHTLTHSGPRWISRGAYICIYLHF